MYVYILYIIIYCVYLLVTSHVNHKVPFCVSGRFLAGAILTRRVFALHDEWAIKVAVKLL